MQDAKCGDKNVGTAALDCPLEVLSRQHPIRASGRGNGSYQGTASAVPSNDKNEPGLQPPQGGTNRFWVAQRFSAAIKPQIMSALAAELPTDHDSHRTQTLLKLPNYPITKLPNVSVRPFHLVLHAARQLLNFLRLLEHFQRQEILIRFVY
jgi:hypothetical protein